MSGVAQWLACWARNPKVRGSKPRSATFSLAASEYAQRTSMSLRSTTVLIAPPCNCICVLVYECNLATASETLGYQEERRGPSNGSGDFLCFQIMCQVIFGWRVTKVAYAWVTDGNLYDRGKPFARGNAKLWADRQNLRGRFWCV